MLSDTLYSAYMEIRNHQIESPEMYEVHRPEIDEVRCKLVMLQLNLKLTT